MTHDTPTFNTLENLLRYMNEHTLVEALVTPGAPVCVRTGDGLANTHLAHIGSQPITPSVCEQMLKEIAEYSMYQKVESLPNESHIVVSWPKLGRFRVFVYRQRSSHAFSIRHVMQKANDLATYKQFSDIESVALHKGGLVLVGNPNTHKVSETLAALLQYRLNHRQCHLVTIEESIDVLYDHGQGVASQREIGIDVADLKAGVESAKRSFSDTVLIDCAHISYDDLKSVLGYAELGGTVFLTGRDCTFDRLFNLLIRIADQDKEMVQRIGQAFSYYINEREIAGEESDAVLIHEVIKGTDKIKTMFSRSNLKEISEYLRSGTVSEDDVLTFDRVLLRMMKAGEISPQAAAEYASTSYYRNRMLVGG